MSRTQLKASTSASSSVKLAALPTSASAANVAAGSLSGTGNGLGMLKEEDTASQAGGGGGVDAGALVGGDEKGGVQAAAPSQSLLKVVLDDYRADRNRTSRLLLCGELETAYGIRSEDIKMLHEDFFGQYDAKETGISGVFFGISYQYAPANSPHVFVHLLEAPSKVLYALLRLLNEDKQQAVAAAAAASAGADDKSAAGGSPLKGGGAGGGDHYHSELDPPMSPPPMGSAAASAAAMAAAMGRGVRAGASGAGGGGAKRLHVWQWMRSARVLSVSEEVPREFPGWFFRPALRFAAVDEYPRPTDFLQPCFAVLRNLLELGREVQPLSLEKAEEYILHKNGQPSRQFMARVPTPAQIACFMTCEDLCTIREYLDIYDSPIDFTLESEKVWPVEPFLKY